MLPIVYNASGTTQRRPLLTKEEHVKQLWMRLPRWLRWIVRAIICLALSFLLLAAWGWWYTHPTVERTDGIPYGERHGQLLTMDVLRPKNPNGLGVAVMVSGGWKSGAARRSANVARFACASTWLYCFRNLPYLATRSERS